MTTKTISLLTPYDVTVSIGDNVVMQIRYHYAGVLPLKEELLAVLQHDAVWSIEKVEDEETE